jgi:TP901-1 family phage major tail protein
MAVNNANVVGLFVKPDGASSFSKVAVATSTELSLSQDTIEVTSKDSSGKAEYIPGKKDGTISVEGFVDPSNDEFSNFFGYLNSTLRVKVSDQVSGNQEYEGDAIVTELTRSGENDSPETFSASLQLTGFINENEVV